MSTEGSPPGPWQSLHVHYGADRRPLLVECVAPLVAEARSRGLLAAWFFENDWLEGAHVRLRLRPSRPADATELVEFAEAALDGFLARRPSLVQDVPPLPYERLFALAPGRLDAYPDGRMPTQVPNTIHHRPYQPEFGRLGGPAGVALAEWHFERSSDLVLEILAATGRTRGPALDLMLAAMTAVLGTTAALRVFAERQHTYWQHALPEVPDAAEREVADLVGHLADAPSEISARWAAHWAELKPRLAATTADGTLMPLLAHHLRLTNNRLGLSPLDEAHLAHVVHGALHTADHVGSVPGQE